MHDDVPRRRNLWFGRHSSREAAGKTHHCLVGTQSTNISKITVSFTLIRKPTHAFFVSPPGPCLLPLLGWRTQIRRLHTPRTSTDFFTCAHAAISTLKVSHDPGWRGACASTTRDSRGRCAVAPGSASCATISLEYYSIRQESRSFQSYLFRQQIYIVRPYSPIQRRVLRYQT